MKRIVCLILIVCLFPVCASALDLEVFNTFAGVFGEPELSGGVVDGKRTTFECDGCSVQFMDENGKTYCIYVVGTGDSFVRYSAAAIMTLYPDSSTFAYNCGQFMSAYLFAKEGEDGESLSAAGHLMLVRKRKTDYVFAVRGD